MTLEGCTQNLATEMRIIPPSPHKKIWETQMNIKIKQAFQEFWPVYPITLSNNMDYLNMAWILPQLAGNLVLTTGLKT